MEQEEEVKEPLETQPNLSIDEYKQENEQLRERLEIFERENAKLRKMLPSKKKLQTEDFWKNIQIQIAANNVHDIKSLINDETINMFDTNPSKQSLLLLSAKHGSYEITQLCLSLGCDINHKDIHQRTAMDYAIKGSFYHIQRLLLYSLYSTKHIDDIKSIATQINTQTFIIHGFIDALSKNNKSNQNLFKIMFVDIIQNMIHNKVAISDDMLMIAWHFTEMKHENPLQSELWQSIESSINTIVDCGTPIDWFWLNSFVIPSKLWFKSVIKSPVEQLYSKLLHMMIKIETEKQRIRLEQNMALLADENKHDWNTLIEWNMKQEIPFDARQDRVPDGLRSKYTVSQLRQLAVMSSSNTDFDVYQFYDYTEYLSKLILLAHSVDTDFHTSIHHLFHIDYITNIGYVQHENNRDKVQYMRCDIPSIAHAQTIADLYYHNEAYPVTAHMCDLNKCLLVFQDITSLLHALNMFIVKIRENQCGNIISVIRDKNGYKSANSGYASIELNILIQGAMHNIIGCVEFVLQIMVDYKERSKHLHRIAQQNEFMDKSVAMLLSQFLDQKKELFIAGNHGDVETLYRLMSLHKSAQYLMTIDDETGESILLNICKLNHMKALQFIAAQVTNELFVDRLFYTNHKNCNPIEALFTGSVSLAMCEIIFSIKEVIQRYQTIPNQLFRLFITMYRCKDVAHDAMLQMIQLIYDKLQLDNDRVVELLKYSYPEPVDDLYAIDCVEFYDKHLSFYVIANGDINIVNHFINIVGEQVFQENIALQSDTRNITPFEYCLFKTHVRYKYKIIKHLLSFDAMLEILNNDIDRLYRIMHWLAQKKISEKVFDFVMNKLELNEKEKLLSVLNRYNSLTTKARKPYADKSIIGVAIRANHVNVCKKLIFIIGDDIFVDKLFDFDHLNTSSIEYAIWKAKLDTIRFIFGMKQVTERILSNDDILFRVMLWCFNKYNKSKFQLIWNALELDDNIVRKLLVHKSKKLDDETVFSKKARTYWDKSLVVITVNGGHLEQVKYFARLDLDIFVKEMFHANKSNLTPLEYLIKNEKISIIKYILNLHEIKTILHKDQEALFRIMYWMFFKYNTDCFDLIKKELEINDKLIISLLNYKAKKPESAAVDRDLNDNCFKYWTYNFVHAAISNSLNAVKRLMECIGDDLLQKKLFDIDPYNVSCLELASVVEYDTFHFLLELPNVIEMLQQNDILLYRLFCHCCRFGNDECYALIKEKCDINDEALKRLLHMQYPRERDDKFEESKFKQTYYDKTLLSWAILGGKSKRIESILPLCDAEHLMKYLLKTDVQGRRPFLYLVKKKKYGLALDILKHIADTENQLKLITIASVELNDSMIQSKFEEMIIENQKEIIRQKSSRTIE